MTDFQLIVLEFFDESLGMLNGVGCLVVIFCALNVVCLTKVMRILNEIVKKD